MATDHCSRSIRARIVYRIPLYSTEIKFAPSSFLYLCQIAHSERRWVDRPRPALRGKARQHDIGRIFICVDRIAMLQAS
jgi:hypothetical protein